MKGEKKKKKSSVDVGSINYLCTIYGELIYASDLIRSVGK